METLYTASATATGGRNGHVETSDGLLSLNLSMPKGLGGPGLANATNPEQLFACGYSACFGSAVEYVAKMKKLPVKEVSVKANVAIGKNNAGGFQLAAELIVAIPGLTAEQIKEVIEAAHHVCPYSNATRGNIEVKLTVADT